MVKQFSLSLLDNLLPWHCPGCDRLCKPSVGCDCGSLFAPARPSENWYSVDDQRLLLVRSSFRFSDPARRLLHRIKYQSEIQWLSLYGRLVDVCLSEPDAVLVPVPSRSWPWLVRGFNPAEEWARYLAKKADMRVRNLLLRRSGGMAQVGKNREQRLGGIRGQFRLRRGEQSPRRVRERVFLVDDVVTTGATLKECSRVLTAAGFEVLGAYTLFRA